MNKINLFAYFDNKNIIKVKESTGEIKKETMVHH